MGWFALTDQHILYKLNRAVFSFIAICNPINNHNIRVNKFRLLFHLISGCFTNVTQADAIAPVCTVLLNKYKRQSI